MKPSTAYERHREAIAAIINAHRGRNPRIFGSVVRGEGTEDLKLLINTTG